MELLQRVHIETIKPVVELYFMLQTNLNESICKITEVINDLLHPPGDRVEETVVLGDITRKQSLSKSKSKSDLTPDQEQDLKYKVIFVDNGPYAVVVMGVPDAAYLVEDWL